jgi:hypothetical protein
MTSIDSATRILKSSPEIIGGSFAHETRETNQMKEIRANGFMVFV